MTILYRGISGSQYVYSLGVPPDNATNVSIISNLGSGAPSDRGTYDTVLDLPNVKSSSTNLGSLSVGDYATVVSSGLFTNVRHYCTDNTIGNSLWADPIGLPKDFSENLEAWWEADRGVTLSGSGVVSWQDQTSNNFLLTSSVADRPTYLTSSTTGPGIEFDGSSSRLSGGDILNLNSTSLTFFLVIKAPSPGASSTIINKRFTGTLGTQPGYQVANFGSNGNFQNSAIDNGSGNATSPAATGNIWGDNQFHVMNIQLIRSEGRFRGIIDRGSSQTAASAPLANWVNLTSSADFGVGKRQPANDQPWEGVIKAILCYREAVTGSKREEIENYLRRRWHPEEDYTF